MKRHRKILIHPSSGFIFNLNLNKMAPCRGFSRTTMVLCITAVLMFCGGLVVSSFDLATSAARFDVTTEGSTPFEAVMNSISQALDEEWVIDKEGAEKRCEVKTYKIRSPQDLVDNTEDLECIFWAGSVPEEVPLGNTACHAITTKHSSRLAFFLDHLWQGHVFTETKCDKGQPKYFDQPTLQFGIKPSVGLVKIEKIDINLAKGEHSEDKDLLTMDYRIDFQTECPAEGHDFPGWMGLSNVFFAPYSPFNPPGAGIFYDIALVVGVDESDGGVILLEKYYTNAPQGYVTIGFLYQKSFDPLLKVQFPSAFDITTSTFSYTETPGSITFADMFASIPGDFISLPKPPTI